MSNTEKIRQEIERLKKCSESSRKEWIDEGYDQNAFAENCRIKSFDKLLAFIDSLPEKDQMPMPEDTVIFQRGVAEGRRLEREDRNDDKLYGD